MLGLGAEEFNPFPHRKHCEWIDQGGGLRVRICDDGEIMMWHDMNTRESWLPSESPPAQWRSYFKKHRRVQMHGLGATAAQAGVCPPKPHIAPRPSQAIKKLQAALQGLAKRIGDKFVSATADGLVGPRTIKATNRAMYMYAKNGAPAELTNGALTRAQLVSFAPQITGYLQRAPFPTLTTARTPAPPPDATGPEAAAPAMPEGDMTMPAYYPPGYAPAPSYYPPGPPRRGPGGLPTDEASLDIRAFVPAQYEHVRINPTMVMMGIGVVVIAYLVLDKKKKGG